MHLQDIKDLFRDCGFRVKTVTLMREDIPENQQSRGKSKGCALVSFFNTQDAERALLEMRNCELMGRKIFIRIDKEEGVGVFFANFKYDLSVQVGFKSNNCLLINTIYIII